MNDVQVVAPTGLTSAEAHHSFGALVGLDRRLEMAMSLGASHMRTPCRVILPLIAPGILAAAIFAFIHSLDEVVVSSFIAGPTCISCRCESGRTSNIRLIRDCRYCGHANSHTGRGTCVDAQARPTLQSSACPLCGRILKPMPEDERPLCDRHLQERPDLTGLRQTLVDEVEERVLHLEKRHSERLYVGRGWRSPVPLRHPNAVIGRPRPYRPSLGDHG
jgi:hypothetical protein